MNDRDYSMEQRVRELEDVLIKEQARVDQLVAAVERMPGVCDAMGHLYETPDSQVRAKIAAGLILPRECSRCGFSEGDWDVEHWGANLLDGKWTVCK